MRIIYSNLFYLAFVPIIVCVSAVNASALTYGLAETIPGYESTTVISMLPDNSFVRDDHTGADTVSELSYSENDLECTLTAMPYSLYGLVSANDLTGSSFPYVVGVSIFRDQIYFETYNDEAAEIVLNFDLNIDWTTNSNASDMYASLEMVARTVDNVAETVFLNDFSGSYLGPISVSTLQQPVTGGLVLSDSYFAFTVIMNAGVNDGTIDWSHSLILNPDDPYSVYQYDAAGNRVKLSPGQFSLISQSNKFPSTAPVPEPATLLLLGSGLFGLAGFRKKLKR